MTITSRSNRQIKEIYSLKDKKARRESGSYIVEGFKMIREARLFGKRIEKIVGTEEGLLELGETGAETVVVSESVYKYLSDEVTPQGALAVVKKEMPSAAPPKGNCVFFRRR